METPLNKPSAKNCMKAMTGILTFSISELKPDSYVPSLKIRSL